MIKADSVEYSLVCLALGYVWKSLCTIFYNQTHNNCFNWVAIYNLMFLYKICWIFSWTRKYL